MKKVMYALLVVMGLHATQVGAQALWQGTEYGMSPAQVLEHIPQAQEPDAPDELAGGATEGLRLGDVRLAGHRFQASFFFAWDALEQVMLSLQAPRPGAVEMEVFEDIARELEATHGAPATDDWRHEPSERRSREWHVAGARVSVVLIGAGSQSFVNVIYRVGPTNAPPPPRLEISR